jgi:hypothetical protein
VLLLLCQGASPKAADAQLRLQRLYPPRLLLGPQARLRKLLVLLAHDPACGAV